jgi:trans-2,3-dihydro-3-hydroxyanthranilate isomerase
VGTAVLLGCMDHGRNHGVCAFGLEETVGLVACVVEVNGEGRGSATFTLPRLPEEVGTASPKEALAQALGLSVADIGLPGHAPSVFSAGVPFSFVPVGGLDAIAKARPDLGAWPAVEPKGHASTFLYTNEVSEGGSSWHARMFAPEMGIGEDPATGGAAAAFAGVIMKFEKPRDGEHSLIIEQGYEMGRPSKITLGLTVEKTELVRATIGGSAVVVSEGSLRL